MGVFPNLFSPIRIGTMQAKNRVMMSAMSINFGVDEKGFVEDQLTAYFEARAKGGAGLMLVGGCAVHPTGVELPDLPKMWDDGCIAPLKKMVAVIKPFDCRFGVQLMHGGRQSYHDQKVAPSAIAAPALVKSAPRALTADEIPEMIAAFGDAARRCQKAGLDFIEIHGAHGYLLNQFLAPNANLRTDKWGGTFENRIRFFIEVFRDVKDKCGDDFPVGVRINGNDYIENGWSLDEACRLAKILEKEGAAYLHVSAGVYGSRQLTIPSMYVEQGCFTHLAEAVKKEVSIPVVAVGRIKKPQMAEEILSAKKADIIALGRSLLADPQWPNKAARNEVDFIRPCVGCCLGCIHAVFQLEPGGCVVNPDVGREHLLADPLAETGEDRSILVVGGGPAGLAAARMAALRGYRVTLCEQKEMLGGALRLASIPPGREELGDILVYLEKELRRLGVEVHLNTALDEALIEEVRPEVVILATGSLPDMPIIKGLFQTGMALTTVTDLLEGQPVEGERIIVLGGNQAGLVLADHLAQQGKQVVVLHRKDHFAEELSSNDRYYLRERLKIGKVTLFKQVTVKAILENGVKFTVNGRLKTLEPFDAIVLADAMAPLREGVNLLRKHNLPVHIIGDAKSSRHLMYAISEGEEVGRMENLIST